MKKETFRKGFYETVYGNAVFVATRTAKTGYDVDMGERVPIALVNFSKFLRRAESRHS